MRESSILLVGLSGLGCELAKNLALAGVGSLTLMDSASVVADRDLSANFFLNESTSVGRNRAAESVAGVSVLNPNVRVESDARSILSVVQSSPEFLMRFAAVILVGQTLPTVVAVNKALREQGRAAAEAVQAFATASAAGASAAGSMSDSSPSSPPQPPPAFFAAEVCGLFGWFLSDLQCRAYTETKKAKDAAGRETEEEVIVAGVASFPTSAAELLTQECAGASSYAAQSKKFGRRKQEKSAHSLWMALRVVLTWRETRPRGLDGSIVMPIALQDSLGEARAAFAAREGVPAAVLDTVLPLSLLVDVAVCSGVDLAHICAIVGGILGQEVLKVISGKDQPLTNTFVYSATVRQTNTTEAARGGTRGGADNSDNSEAARADWFWMCVCVSQDGYGLIKEL